jgi:CGNR zinc finger
MAPNPLQEPIDALRFLVEFAQTDLGRMTPRPLVALERRVQDFVHRESPPADLAGPTLHRIGLGVLQERALPILADIAKERPLTFANDLVLTFWVFRDRTGIRVEVGGSDLDRFLYQIIRVLEAVGVDRLKSCPECDRLFIKVTKKKFCSTRCQSRAYMRGYREELYGKPKRAR